MSRVDPNQGILPSFLDRLIDPESGGTSWRRGYGVEQMTDAVRRDLEDLMNTRQSHVGLPEAFKEVHQSLIAYGLPDLTSLNAITTQQRQEIGGVIEGVVSRFEPRLKDIRVTMIDPGDSKDRTLKFRIDARLRLDPSPDVAFDTILELSSGHTSVKSS
jgi:type VI secretion system protein ImpF